MAYARRPGLSTSEARARLAELGPNTLGEAPRPRPVAIFLRQFTGLLVVVLIVAGVVAAALGEWADAIAIALVVVLNGVLGFVQEWRAETALAALGAMLAPQARVRRDGEEQLVERAELVPGDLALLAAGDKVPADLVLAEAVELQLDESALTGESLPVDRGVGEGAFMGTAVVSGHGEGEVSATGRATRFGEIAELTAGTERKPTHLQVTLAKLARQMAVMAVLLGLAVAAAGLIAGYPLKQMFLMALSLAVAIVPEGLPAVVTVTLALGAAAMVRGNALARRLQAMETLGAASVICTDKTGTLTEDRMTATKLWLPGGACEVTGGGYDPAGHIARGGEKLRAGDDSDLGALLETALACNRAALHPGEDGWRLTGSPTEGALVVLAMKGWTPEPGAMLAERPFSSERKRMAVLVEGDDGPELHVKGAPDRVLARCSHALCRGEATLLDQAERARIEAAHDALAGEGARVIALARRKLDAPALPEDDEGLTFLGFVALMDPPRAEVAEAIAAADEAGIRVILITGDGAETARAVAGMIGLVVDRVVTGPELEAMDDAALDAALSTRVLFARTAPAHKMRLVRALQARGGIVAMTGDGVNDAPALKQADIGVAMGIRGTDVARDAADLVLLDDDFSTILRAVREGRRQFENLRKFVRYLLSSNAGEVVALLAGIVMGWPLIFLATQILWMNLVTDGVTAVALGLEKVTPGTMKRPPRDPREGVIGRAGLALILAFGAYTGAAALYAFSAALPGGEDLARTTAFTAMVAFEMASVFAFRSFRHSNSTIGWLSNPFLLLALAAMAAAQLAAVYWAPLATILHAVPLGWGEWGLIGMLCLPLVVVPEVVKVLGLGARGGA